MRIIRNGEYNNRFSWECNCNPLECISLESELYAFVDSVRIFFKVCNTEFTPVKYGKYMHHAKEHFRLKVKEMKDAHLISWSFKNIVFSADFCKELPVELTHNIHWLNSSEELSVRNLGRQRKRLRRIV